MYIDVVVKRRSGDSFAACIDSPNECNWCGKGIESAHIFSYELPIINSAPRQVVSLFRCPACNMCMMVEYQDEGRSFKRLGILPNLTDKYQFSSYINEISPNFTNIYNQAYQAEMNGFNLICGSGYRKSLEFLVKDYAIMKHPDKESDIIKSSLSQCISEYISNTDIQDIAKASAWIGNDEVHYERKHPEYSFDDLKAFIQSIVSYIEMEESSAKARKLLSSRS